MAAEISRSTAGSDSVSIPLSRIDLIRGPLPSNRPSGSGNIAPYMKNSVAQRG
jgi:hypothetical protein